MDHGTHKLNVDYVGEFTGFVEVVETTHFHRLPGNLVGDLEKIKEKLLQ